MALRHLPLAIVRAFAKTLPILNTCLEVYDDASNSAWKIEIEKRLSEIERLGSVLVSNGKMTPSEFEAALGDRLVFLDKPASPGRNVRRGLFQIIVCSNPDVVAKDDPADSYRDAVVADQIDILLKRLDFLCPSADVIVSQKMPEPDIDWYPGFRHICFDRGQISDELEAETASIVRSECERVDWELTRKLGSGYSPNAFEALSQPISMKAIENRQATITYRITTAGERIGPPIGVWQRHVTYNRKDFRFRFDQPRVPRSLLKYVHHQLCNINSAWDQDDLSGRFVFSEAL